jgi:hypothetical protein
MSVALASTFLVLIAPAVVRSEPPTEFSPAQDFIISAVEAGLKELHTDFELSEPIEISLIASAFRGKVKEGTSVLSITLIRPQMGETPDRTFHKKFNDRFSIKMVKLTSSHVDNPIALVVVSTFNDKQIDADQRLLVWDGTKWNEKRISPANK